MYGLYRSKIGSSRLVRSEQKKMFRQAAVLLVLAVGLLLLFLFLIVPGSIRLFNYFTAGKIVTDLSDDIPPQIPIINAPVSATNSATIKLTGFAEAGSEVVLLLNNSESARQKVNDDGTFEFGVDLTKGENKINAYSIDTAQNESSQSRDYNVVFDDQAPRIEISEPQSDQQFELRKNQVITIKGLTEENAKVYVNGRLTLAKNTGEFATTYSLSEGENILQIKAEDKAGNVSELELKVNFKL